ncbi:beta-N-acetylglucosaminidase domain-containing protein [Deinococcus yunweiensis]|uniref:beta-N-acetylglucosaminidase domain-containing protein n=1 Tax=Deinococcus yunweiensis TaxID=367282 RepID=UPI00398EF7E4
MKFLGVIEGFYGPPWTVAQRSRLFARMQAWGMETYLYAPKDDPWHRQRWREQYPPEHAQALADLTAVARQHGVRLVYALSPGLDLDWNAPDDRRALTDKFAQVAALGVTDFALLFDDIPYSDDRAAQARVQVQAAHEVMDALWPAKPGGHFLFCPTEYCADRAVPTVATSPYLHELGTGLRPEIEIFWTGPQVVSPQIDVAGILEVNTALRRPVLLWDNLHASDYTLHRLHLGPYAGRPLELRAHLSGILSNPNTPLEPNTPGLHSLADYARADAGWTPEVSLDAALRAWLPEFGAAPDDTELLDGLRVLADALYLPGTLGPRAQALLDEAHALHGDSPAASAQRLRDASYSLRRVLRALEAGSNRDLLFDLHPFLIDLIEELHRLSAPQSGRGADDPAQFVYRGSLADRLLALGWAAPPRD